MKLSVLMAAMESRQWQVLADRISFQISRINASAELIVLEDSGEQSSGQKRHALMQRAAGEYVAFVDDDDRVAPAYIRMLLDAIRQKPDVITFDLEMVNTSRPNRRENWSFGLHGDRRRHGKMAANHLCAWRTDIAAKVAWCPDLGYGDDQLWYKPLHASGLARSEVHIPSVLYYYLFSRSTTSNQTSERIQFSKRYFSGGIRCFRNAAGDIFIETPAQNSDNTVTVRDACNGIFQFNLMDLEQFHTVTLS